MGFPFKIEKKNKHNYNNNNNNIAFVDILILLYIVTQGIDHHNEMTYDANSGELKSFSANNNQ